MTELLAMTGIVKEFPGVRALDGVDLDVRAGEVHCLLGQNGAGKSTLIKVLPVRTSPTQGTIHWQREEVRSTPDRGDRPGIATIYQELDLVPDLDVAENIFLGHEPARYGFSAGRGAPGRELLPGLGHARSGRPEVGSLSAAGQQDREHGPGALARRQLIVMDEPSAVLDQRRSRTSSGSSATSPRAAWPSSTSRTGSRRFRQIGDRVTVLKDGAHRRHRPGRPRDADRSSSG
jgi:ribose transport system ATP-binding protein